MIAIIDRLSESVQLDNLDDSWQILPMSYLELNLTIIVHCKDYNNYKRIYIFLSGKQIRRLSNDIYNYVLCVHSNCGIWLHFFSSKNRFYTPSNLFLNKNFFQVNKKMFKIRKT